MQVTLKAINERLAAAGCEARVERGDGYFYFSGGDALDWLDRTVKVPTLASLTLAQWVDEFMRLKKMNESMLRPKDRTRPR